MSSVEFNAVSKSYSIYSSPGDRLKELITFNRARFHRDFWALRDVSFEARKGETFCIVGENGSGKSTLLQLVAGIMEPTHGTVAIGGRVSALLELGSGFNQEFSGRDNVYLNGAIVGFSAREMDRKYRDIVEFAEIGEFIDQPVKTYSSGMIVRLAFAVAIHVDPEILLVDEALAVGDIYFRQRCMRKVHELRSKGITILFVSHATSDVKALGDRALWLDHGEVKDVGDPDRVIAKYLAAMTQKDSAYQSQQRAVPAARASTLEPPEVITTIPNIDHRFGDGRAEILGIQIAGDEGHSLAVLQPNTTIVVRISARAKDQLMLPVIGFMFRNHLGMDFAGTNTAREGFELPPMNAGEVFTVDFHVTLPELYASTFSFSPAIAEGTLEHYSICDWIDNAVALQMMPGEMPVYGHLHLKCKVELNRPISVPVPAAVVGE